MSCQHWSLVQESGSSISEAASSIIRGEALTPTPAVKASKGGGLSGGHVSLDNN